MRAFQRLDILGNGKDLAIVHDTFAYLFTDYLLARFEVSTNTDIYKQHSLGGGLKLIPCQQSTDLELIIKAPDVKIVSVDQMDDILFKNASVLKLMQEVNKKLTARVRR